MFIDVKGSLANVGELYRKNCKALEKANKVVSKWKKV